MNHDLKNTISIIGIESQEKKRNKYVTLAAIVSPIILLLTMIAIFCQARHMQDSVQMQSQFNSSSLRPYLGVDPSLMEPFIRDTLFVVTTSISNFGKTPAYNLFLIGRITSSDSFPSSLLRRLIDEDLEVKGAILFPVQPGMTFDGISAIRDGISGNAISGVSLETFIQQISPLYYHVYCEYESGWGERFAIRTSFEYKGGTMWSTLFASEELILN